MRAGLATPSCHNCTHWRLQAVEAGQAGVTPLEVTTLLQFAGDYTAVQVGTWSPLLGLALQDDLLPHVTGGFRGRILTVASLE